MKTTIPRGGATVVFDASATVAARRSEDLVRIDRMALTDEIPWLVEPAIADVDLAEWAAANRDLLDQLVWKSGGILFRSFQLAAQAGFERVVRALATELLDYVDQHTPRTALGGRIYTSTEYPADRSIPFHSENSKNKLWPRKIWFFCVRPAERGGETPLADNRKVFQLLDAELRQRFVDRGVMYVRNFSAGVGLPWQVAFQTDDPAVVEERCSAAAMEVEWKQGDRLRVRHVAQAVATHPVTGEPLWFNQAHLFHPSSLDPEVRRSLLAAFAEDELPSDARYGDGSPIGDAVLAAIREAYERSAVRFSWQAGDLLMLDNMLVSHGRAPFEGPRQILVAMAEPYGS